MDKYLSDTYYDSPPEIPDSPVLLPECNFASSRSYENSSYTYMPSVSTSPSNDVFNNIDGEYIY